MPGANLRRWGQLPASSSGEWPDVRAPEDREQLYRRIAAVLLPDSAEAALRVVSGQFHDVVLVPGIAAVRIARTGQAAQDLPRSTELLHRLIDMDLPFATPRPLSPVTSVEGHTAVAISWIEGEAPVKGSGDARQCREVLEALAGVDLDVLAGVLAVPHSYAGGIRWVDFMLGDVVPRLPTALQDEARRRVEAVLALESVEPSLVHGDLAGDNLRVTDGALTGVLDWDLAAAWDPAVDAACLAWYGWDAVRRAVDPGTYRRARVWYGVFGLEQVSAAILNGEDDASLQPHLERACAGLEERISPDC